MHQKTLKSLFIFLLLLTPLFIEAPFTFAAPVPTCTISYTPSTVKQGENSTEYWSTTGPLNGMSTKCTGILSYIGGYTMDFTDPEFLKSLNAQELINGTSNSGQIRPSKIGEGSCTITVWGPGGSNTCSATIKVVANEVYDESKTIIFGNPITFHLVGNEKVRACPSFTCGVSQWGTYNGDATIKKQQNEWYFVSIVDKGKYIDGRFYTSGSIDGWLNESLIPNDILNQLKLKNPDAFQEKIEEEKATSTIQETVTEKKNPLLQFLFLIKEWLGKKEIIYPVLTVIAIILLYLIYRLFSKIKFSDFIHEVKLIKISRTQFIVSIIILGFVSFGWFGFTIYKQTQQTLKTTSQELTKTREEIQSLEISQEETFTKQQSLLEQQSAQLQQAQTNEAATRQALQELQNKPMLSSSDKPTGAFLSQFSQSVVKMLCFANSYSTDIKQGTGVLYKTSSQSELSPFYVQTNLHVVQTDDNSISSCFIVLYPDYTNSNKYLLFRSNNYRFFKNYIDVAFVKVEIINDSSINNRGTSQDLNPYAQAESETYYCSSAEIGASLSVFGYPAIGGETLTITDGIISGVETDNNGVRYYKTSAKIDQGNSGGIAIEDSGCVVGIPTFVQRGQLESIGRILDLRYVFSNLLR